MNDAIDVLKKLDEAGIQHCVLRNYEFAAGGEVDGDIDILVRSQDRDRIDRILTNSKFYPFKGDTTEQTRYRGYRPGDREIITIDLYWETPTYNGLPILDGERVLKNRRQNNDVWIPKKEDYFVELAFHSVLNKNHYRKKYRAELDRLRQNVHKGDVREHARDQFGPLGEWVVNQSLKGEYDTIIPKKWKLVRAGLHQSPEKIFILFWNLIILREFIHPIQSLAGRLVPGRPTVAILGPDGIGKSTVVAGVTEALNEMGLRTRSANLGIHSGASPFLRIVRRIYNRASKQPSQSSARSKGKAKLGPKSSSWKSIVLFVDWISRYMKTQWIHTDVIIADRYLHELVVYAKPGPIQLLLSSLSPTVGVVLEDEINSLVARSEFERESVKEFQEELKQLNWSTVQVSEKPDETVDRVLDQTVPELLRTRSGDRF